MALVLGSRFQVEDAAGEHVRRLVGVIPVRAAAPIRTTVSHGFVLQAHDGSTRLISRNRFRLPTIAARIGMLPMEPGSLLMERKMLLGIKERAERLA